MTSTTSRTRVRWTVCALATGSALLACACSSAGSRASAADAGARDGAALPAADAGADGSTEASAPDAGSDAVAVDGGKPDVAVEVLPCNEGDGGSLPVGVWENITPPQINLDSDAGLLGTLLIEIDPLNPATLYTTGDHQGLFRSNDCGATWSKINTGTNGPVLDTGSEWVLRIDPTTPTTMYSSPLYGADPSLLKSTNGGVDWVDVMPKGSGVQSALQYMFFQDAAIDPTDPMHLLTTFHVDCVAPYNPVCLAESNDGGATWRIINGPPSLTSWTEDAGPVILNATNLFFGAPFAGLFRTTDDGVTWTQVAAQGYHHFYASAQGWTYMGSAQNGIYRSQDPASADATASAWTAIPGTLTTVGASIVGDGLRIFAGARSYVQNQTAAESDGLTWSMFAVPDVVDGATEFNYDPVHHLLFSTNTNSGLWRYVTH